MANLTVGAYLSTVYMKRSGVIPYYLDPKTKKIIFLLAIDRRSGDYTDFGGGVKQTETALSGAKREFLQETNGIYGSPSLQQLSSCPCMYDTKKSISLIFLPLKNKESRQQSPANAEISGTSRLTIQEMKRCKKVWTRVWKLLKSIEPFEKELVDFYNFSLI